ncbi:ABC transporter permease [Anoxynatronum buryatiense]|uniref:Peptide/nickel transport system permease protein n=1 Tax=Anoxynatronum buryatiense TaxID=489973 RepID=A0AA46AJH4_9CLOT|nr:ABC transporter permease [Anoxynatronum buryatiense]SMP62568.1 peptide/nickel transport system permease protein [Anoxynatronum buryatiense]
MKRQYLAKKIIQSLVTIFFVLVFNYILFRVMPGNPLAMIMRNPRASQEAIERTRELFGLNQSWVVQFWIYLKHLFTGDLGISFLYRQPVTEIIVARIIPTVLMVGLAQILAIIVGVFLGVISAWKRGSRVDVAALGFSLVTYSMPTFWLGIILIFVFSVSLRWFPTSGMLTPGQSFSSTFAMVRDAARHLVLPVLTLSLVLIGEYTLTMRNTLLDVLTEDYMTTAKAKGFDDNYLIKKHALPNAMLPMITLIAINLGLVIGGTIQVETIFSWPGLGRLMFDALKARDYPLLQGIFLLITLSVIVANLIADVTYGYFDPRVRE